MLGHCLSLLLQLFATFSSGGPVFIFSCFPVRGFLKQGTSLLRFNFLHGPSQCRHHAVNCVSIIQESGISSAALCENSILHPPQLKERTWKLWKCAVFKHLHPPLVLFFVLLVRSCRWISEKLIWRRWTWRRILTFWLLNTSVRLRWIWMAGTYFEVNKTKLCSL